MEYQLANWLKKGNWDDLPFNAGKIRHYNNLEEPPKRLDSRWATSKKNNGKVAYEMWHVWLAYDGLANLGNRPLYPNSPSLFQFGGAFPCNSLKLLNL